MSERSFLRREDPPRLKRWVLLWLKRWLYPTADYVTAVSAGVAKELREKLRLPRERVTVVYNPIVTPELAKMAGEDPCHPWLADGNPVVLGVGRLVQAKGFECLIDAFAHLRKVKEARLIILGEGPEREPLSEKVKAAGLADLVQLPGFVSNPFSYMSRCTVFVLSSRNEGLPGSLIQAMACGAAVISTDCHAGPSEIVTNEVNGYLVPVDDPMAISSRIEYLLDHPEVRAGLGRKGLESVQRFGSPGVRVVPY